MRSERTFRRSKAGGKKRSSEKLEADKKPSPGTKEQALFFLKMALETR
jgi:hypothetical protein